MKYFTIAILTAGISFLAFSCLKSNDKSCQAMAPETEEPSMKSYCTANNITYSKLSNSLYYQVIDSGSGNAPDLKSTIKVTYIGKLLNGTAFDSATSPIQLSMASLIEGWQTGLPLIKKGGRIKLVIPSYLGYGCSENAGIPANSVLYFDIKLADVQ